MSGAWLVAPHGQKMLPVLADVEGSDGPRPHLLAVGPGEPGSDALALLHKANPRAVSLDILQTLGRR
jgi:hypothetical protein